MTSQTEFRAGLLDPTVAAPAGLQDADQGPSGKRYDVYRNNVTHSLISALGTAFPLVHKLIGAQRFAAIAPQFVRAHPPSSPLMMFYGAEFPAFLKNLPALKQFGYLPDAARLDVALRQSYHAADTEPFTAENLQALAPEALMQSRFSLSPATRIIRSVWPLFDIWRYAMQTDAPKPNATAQDVLVTRPAFDPAPHALPPGGADWLEALAAGQTFEQAHETALNQTPEFALADVLGLTLQTGALSNPTTRT